MIMMIMTMIVSVLKTVIMILTIIVSGFGVTRIGLEAVGHLVWD